MSVNSISVKCVLKLVSVNKYLIISMNGGICNSGVSNLDIGD